MIREPSPQRETLVLVRRDPPPEVHLIATENDISTVRRSNLWKFRTRYHLDAGVGLIVPGKEWRASCPPLGWICIYEDQLRAGLRFPLHPFIRVLLHCYQIPITQIVPNGIRLVIKFLLICGEQGVEPSVELF